MFSRKVCLHSSDDVWKCCDSVLGHEDCQAANRQTPSSKTPTAKTVQTIARKDQLPLTGGQQNVNDQQRWPLIVQQLFIRYIRRSCSMKTTIHQHGQLRLYSVSDAKPAELVTQIQYRYKFNIDSIIRTPVVKKQPVDMFTVTSQIIIVTHFTRWRFCFSLHRQKCSNFVFLCN